MKRTLQKHLMNDTQLATVVKEIEAVINTRPLTDVDSEPDHVLKPSDFLTTGRCLTTEIARNSSSVIAGTVTKQDLIRSWRRGLMILDEFKEMFENRYLPSLRQRYDHGQKEPRVTSKLNPSIGQIVQIKGDSRNRIGWKVGQIVSLIKGADGLCRVARVKVGNMILTRSIAQLYPLEIEDGEEKCTELPKETEETSPDETSRPTLEIPYTIEDDQVERLPRPEVGESDSRRMDEDEESITGDVNTAGQLGEPVSSTNLVEPEVNDLCEPESSEINDRRPKRAAATRAMEKIRRWTRNLMIYIPPLVGECRE